jgi:hypothetical protein
LVEIDGLSQLGFEQVLLPEMGIGVEEYREGAYKDPLVSLLAIGASLISSLLALWAAAFFRAGAASSDSEADTGMFFHTGEGLLCLHAFTGCCPVS